VLLLAGGLFALPTAIWIAAFLAAAFIDVRDHPWLVWIQHNQLPVAFLSQILLVPFGFMFLVSGALMVRGVCEGTALRRWRTLFEWRRRFRVMYALGYVATGAELATLLLKMVLADGDAKPPGVIERGVEHILEACPIVFLTFGGMRVLTSAQVSGVWATILDAIRWSYRGLKADGFAAFIAVGVAVVIAAVSAMLVLPFPLLGLPLLLAVVGVLHGRLEQRDQVM
jgi:hypothetical protein